MADRSVVTFMVSFTCDKVYANEQRVLLRRSSVPNKFVARPRAARKNFARAQIGSRACTPASVTL